MAYQSYQSKQQKAHYDSNIYIQYDNVYQLFAFLYHSHEENPEQWINELIKLSLDDIADFCDVIENSQLTPIIDNQIIEGGLVPEYIDSIKIGAVTAVTEFECKERPL